MSQIISSSLIISGSVQAVNFIGTFTGSVETASYVNTLNQDVTLTGSLNILGNINAVNLYVQTITSSTEYISGSTIFGSLLSNTHQFTGSVSITGSLNATASQAITASYALNGGGVTSTVYTKEIHVSSGSGDDTTGTGTLLNPYKTVTKAFSVVGSTGECVVIHPGVYVENPTLTAVNVTITSVNTGGGITFISGTLTISGTSSSTRINGIRATNLTKTAAGQLYLNTCQVPGTFTNSGTGYVEITDSDLQGLGINVTGASQMVFSGGKQNLITVNNASAVVTVKDGFTCVSPTVTQGTFASIDSVIYSTAVGTAAINSSAGTVVSLYNSIITNPSGTPEKVAIAGFVGFDNITFNRTGSTLGTSLNTQAHFQTVSASNGANTVGFHGTSSYAVSSSYAETASLLLGSVVSASFATTASYKANAEYLTVVRTGTNQTVATGTDVVFDSIVSQNGISYNNTNGQFTLQGGQAYRVTCQLSTAFASSANGTLDFGLVDTANNLFGAIYASPVNINATAWVSYGNMVDLVIVPPSTQNYKIRVIASDSATNTIIANRCYLTITKLN